VKRKLWGGWKEPLSMVPQTHIDSGARSEKLTIPELEQSKAVVLNTLASVHSRRSYAFAIDRFIGWYCSETIGIFAAMFSEEKRGNSDRTSIFGSNFV
jgi:hypothetical protein